MTRMLLTTPKGSWEVVPVNTLAAIPLAVFTAYTLFRAALFMVALRDVYYRASLKHIMFPRRSKWAPDKSRLNKTVFHCIIGGVLLALYIDVGGYFGWLEFVEQQ